MSRQAKAERERQARVIAADGEYQASTKAAARAPGETPGARWLRLLQTVVDALSALAGSRPVLARHRAGQI